MKKHNLFQDLPIHRPPHPGELIADLLEDHGLTQQAFADMLGIARHRLNEIVNGNRSITPDTALRLARALDTTPGVWLREQAQRDLWDALHGPSGKDIAKVTSLKTKVA